MSRAPHDTRNILHRRKYELLLFGLIQHLFIAVFLPDLEFYRTFIWPINMAVLGVFSVGVFAGRSRAVRSLKNVTLALVVGFPFVPMFVAPTPFLMECLSLAYVAFFITIFVEVLRFLLRPSYINVDIVSASACGYLLLLEVGIFTMQALNYALPNAFQGLSEASFTATYLDIVYFSSITITSIGFGDILPVHHIAKLATAMLGIAGQFYSVVLMGILISKYTSSSSGPPSKGEDADAQ
jgi:hypothetical protein